jgi:hypothetical protein
LPFFRRLIPLFWATAEQKIMIQIRWNSASCVTISNPVTLSSKMNEISEPPGGGVENGNQNQHKHRKWTSK